MTNAQFKPLLVPVILAGGGGTRLWPLSRGHYPKQFLALGGGDESLLQQTLVRLAGLDGTTVAAPLVVANEEHRFLVAEQARVAGVELAAIVLEPEERNTAPALTAAALRSMADGQDPLLLMMPTDHLIADLPAFRRAVGAAIPHALDGVVVTFGVAPTHAEPGFGYIRTGELVGDGGAPDVRVVRAFIEKPDTAVAQTYVEDGGYLWNAGLFMLRASAWVTLVERYCPAIVAAVRSAVALARSDGDFFRLQGAAFKQSPSDSVDYAVMEPLGGAGGIRVVTLDAGWSEVGDWSGLWSVSPKDARGNVGRGNVCAIDSYNNLVFAEHRLVATLGCSDMVVVETADAVLVAGRERAQDVKSIVDWLARAKRDERLTHRRVFRPWGSYEGIDGGHRFQVKHIVVKPGASLSLQIHHHRAEHWIVVSGTARVTCGDETFLLSENQSTYIPLGTRHRLENPGTIPLNLIEVQSGPYLGEDDIVRLEDAYNRAN